MELLSINELQTFVNKTCVIFDSQKKDTSLKQLIVNLRGGFEIWHNGKKVGECMQPFIAVEAYNNIIL